MGFNLLIDFRAHQDLDEAMEYYMSKNPSVARKLYYNIQDAYTALESNPFLRSGIFTTDAFRLKISLTCFIFL